MGKALEVEDVKMDFGNLHALDGISFGIEEKTVTILIGPNGSGKTTLINVVSGLYTPTSGKILFLGKDITGLEAFRINRMGLARTFQIPTLFAKLTVFENVMVAKKGNPGESFSKAVIKRSWAKTEGESSEEAFRVLKNVGLLQMWDKPASSLSGGQMKLLELGRVLMTGAKIIMLDEPISGVNPTLAHEIFAKLLTMRDQFGLTFLVVEHRLDIALSYVDSVVAMAYGKLIAQGDPESVMKNEDVIDAYLGG